MKAKRWDARLLGRLVGNSEIDNQTVFVNTNNTLQFYIKIISESPSDFPIDVKIVTCYSDSISQWGFDDDSTLSEYERIERIKEFLRDSLLIFQVEKRISDFREYFIATNITITPKKDSYSTNMTFIPIPIFTSSEEVDKDEFEKRLLTNKYVGHNNSVSKEDEDTPSFVVWKDEDKGFITYGEFDSHRYAHGGFLYLSEQELKRIELDQELIQEIHTYEDKLFFIPYSLHQEIYNRLKQGDVISNIPPETENPDKENKEEEEKNSEIEFMTYFKEKTKELGLVYSDVDLYNFHIAMKTQSLVILSGMSGTGKSQLVSAYSKALGLAQSHLNFISVRPSWTDDSDLIGYPDTLNNVYRPGDSGLVNTLIKAEADEESENLYIVCFDEMNLARVEHYFAQFLSVLETDTRILKLYNEDLQYRFYNGEQYRSSLVIKDNVMFVGTVNIDETTHNFSDKVLDRANVIKLEVLNYANLLDIEVKKSKPRERVVTAKEYSSYRNKDKKISLEYEELNLLWDIHNALKNTSEKLGIGLRVIKQIDKYLKNIPSDCPFSRQEALDVQIVQRIMTKIRGSEDVLKPLIGDYIEQQDTVTNSILFEIFDRYNTLSDFTKTRLEIIQKSKEINRNGFTI